jgi:DHA1 family multidrug resistance protein-like MFS transporter
VALLYGSYYLFFEAYPLVFIDIYHFTAVEQGLAYLGFCAGCAFAFGVLMIFLKLVVKPRLKAGTFQPEQFLILAMWTCPFMPISLFLFGFTAHVHWLLPIISQSLFVVAAFNIFQCGLGYLANNYPRYLASVYAGNALVRGIFAFAFPLFGQAMYKNLSTPRFSVAWGSALLGFLAIGMATIPFLLYRYGPALRGRSKYAN